eukprot:CAMPEP_0170468238 /NCGR_PEP_ID=MMETSP0123-20130129/11495_1 /TAXON_ID=182087 /ORGANISM="Favella ehrenbergii, Strain Fehren 1" /LENGTH=60 /DNA_ID=CAMNT_0010734761 /DNA_START=61 /DNA_END=243 /DNA_ORIENTATION=+
MMCGGHSALKQADEDEVAMFMGLKGECEAQAGQQYQQFEVVGITSQVVAGTNFQVKLRTE